MKRSDTVTREMLLSLCAETIDDARNALRAQLKSGVTTGWLAALALALPKGEPEIDSQLERAEAAWSRMEELRLQRQAEIRGEDRGGDR